MSLSIQLYYNKLFSPTSRLIHSAVKCFCLFLWQHHPPSPIPNFFPQQARPLITTPDFLRHSPLSLINHKLLVSFTPSPKTHTNTHACTHTRTHTCTHAKTVTLPQDPLSISSTSTKLYHLSVFTLSCPASASAIFIGVYIWHSTAACLTTHHHDNWRQTFIKPNWVQIHSTTHSALGTTVAGCV